MTTSSRETIRLHARLLTEAMEEKLPKDVGGMVVLFHKDGNGLQELGCTISKKDLIVLVLSRAAEKLIQDVSRIIRPGIQ